MIPHGWYRRKAGRSIHGSPGNVNLTGLLSHAFNYQAIDFL
jgi:hypothetical protein